MPPSDVTTTMAEAAVDANAAERMTQAAMAFFHDEVI